MNKKSLYALAIAVVGLMITGQILIYVVNPYHTSADSWCVDDIIEYELTTNTSSDYNVLLMSEGIHISDELMIFYDSDYESCYNKPYVQKMVELMRSELLLRNVNCIVVDSQELMSKIETDIGQGKTCARLLVLTGALPCTVYEGKPDDLIFKWLGMGATLYWTGHSIGRYVAYPSEITVVEEGYGLNFLGIPDADIRNDIQDMPLYASEKSKDYEISKGLSIMYNDSTFGLNVQNLSGYKSIGYTSEGYDSIVLTEFVGGDGMIVIFGGGLRGGLLPAIAQVIASKYTYESALIKHISGRIDNTTVVGSIEKESVEPHIFYAYVGVPQIYGKSFTH